MHYKHLQITIVLGLNFSEKLSWKRCSSLTQVTLFVCCLFVARIKLNQDFGNATRPQWQSEWLMMTAYSWVYDTLYLLLLPMFQVNINRSDRTLFSASCPKMVCATAFFRVRLLENTMNPFHSSSPSAASGLSWLKAITKCCDLLANAPTALLRQWKNTKEQRVPWACLFSWRSGVSLQGKQTNKRGHEGATGTGYPAGIEYFTPLQACCVLFFLVCFSFVSLCTRARDQSRTWANAAEVGHKVGGGDVLAEGGKKGGREQGREETGGKTSGDMIGRQDSPRKTHSGFISHQRVYFGAFHRRRLGGRLTEEQPFPVRAIANANGWQTAEKSGWVSQTVWTLHL